MSSLDEIKILKELLDSGAITQEEYDAKKTAILNAPAQQYQPAQPIQQAAPTYEKSKVAAGLFAILLGALGIHKFYLGYTSQGLIMLLVSILTLGLGAIVMEIIGLIEGILYLTKTDEEFERVYVQGRKGWF